MYTEGFEDLEEAQRESHRNYGASSDMDRLLRENDRLKKSLEKEKFFNKLLDQEIQELKSSIPGHANYPSEYWSGKKGVSKGTFYTLLVISLGMAAYIGYGIYYDKKFNYLNLGKNSFSVTPAAASSVTPATATTAPANSNEQPKSTVATSDVSAGANVPPAVVKDSVPNIIGSNKTASPEKQTSKQKAAVPITPDDEYDEDEVNAVIREETTSITRNITKPAAKPAAPVTTPALTTSSSPASAQPGDAKAVIGKYRINSKANFYNTPDENNMRSTFISGNKVVEALEEKNGFIFVAYTNDLGFTVKGWLSKKDLSKE